MPNILIVNPGSTSTKLGLFTDAGAEVATSSVRHDVEDLAACADLLEQLPVRQACVESFLSENGGTDQDLAAVVGRGGLLHPIPGGVYRVNGDMLADLRASRYGAHASNLGAILANEIVADKGCPAFIVDPVVVDEMDDIAKMTGVPELPRRSAFHALNQKSAAREVAAKLGKPYEDCNLIVAHMGGGISVGAHRKGRVVDVNDALDGDGPIAPERAGTLPAGPLVDMCFEEGADRSTIRRKIAGGGGMVAHCGTNRFDEVAAAANSGDPMAKLVREAIAYKVSQEIAKHGATLSGDVDRIVLTGGLAHDIQFVEAIKSRVSFLAPIEVIPGERELESLLRGGLAALNGEQEILEYKAQ